MDEPRVLASGGNTARGHAAWPRRFAPALLLGLAYYLLASPAAHMTYGGTLAAIVWPAPALAIAVLWRLPYRHWGACLLAILPAMMAAGQLDTLPLAIDFQYALLNVFEVALCAFLGRRLVAPQGRLETVAQFTRFVLLLPLAGCAVVAAAGATIATNALGLDWLPEWRAILVGNGLAVLVLVPA
ncbi:MAG: MASE1 domain-containing protein, partial [Burkholderiaceae bacterium]